MKSAASGWPLPATSMRGNGDTRALRAALTTATFVNLAWNSVRRLKNREIRPLSTARLELALIYSGQGSH